jgi:hypothetical protein
MNNPLAQKYNYYLNESHRLSEELQNETEYSELLENILVELIGEEAFYGLFEDMAQTKARRKQTTQQAKNLKAKYEKASAVAWREGQMGSADSANLAHKKAATIAGQEIALAGIVNKERRSKKLYGRDGKILEF